MKIRLNSILLIGLLSCASVQASAISAVINVSLKKQNPKREYKDLPPKGKRTPAAPESCIIDFQNMRIDSSIEEEIEIYEVLNPEGTYAVASFLEDSDFIEYLSELNGAYEIRLVGEVYEYTGHLNL